MDLQQIASAASEALTLLTMHPLMWLTLVVIFLITVEGLMFVPYVGFVAKLMVASLGAAQMFRLFAEAAIGEPPKLSGLLSAFSFSASAQLVLFASVLVPFFAALAYLYFEGGSPAAKFFFGNILKDEPPGAELFTRFKVIMQVLALPFTFVAGAVVITGLGGWAAMSVAFSAAATHWLAVLVLLVLNIGFEIASIRLTQALPGAVGIPFSIALLVAFLLWSFSFTYTLSKYAFPASSGAL